MSKEILRDPGTGGLPLADICYTLSQTFVIHSQKASNFMLIEVLRVTLCISSSPGTLDILFSHTSLPKFFLGYQMDLDFISTLGYSACRLHITWEFGV